MPARPAIALDDCGVRRVTADDPAALAWGMGWCHAADRGLQMLVMRLLGRGQASEHLASNDAMLHVDFFFRRMNWRATGPAAAALPEDVRRFCEAYCAGANEVLLAKPPWELRLLGYRPDPWTLGDSLLLSRMAGYITLAQSQAEIERLLVEMVHAGVDGARLEELFPGQLEGLDVGLVRALELPERVVPPALWGTGAPRLMASNNWVVAGSRTASGKPILANDPHLEVNRLPAVWYELALGSGSWTAVGATMPGLPALIIGRTPDLAWGVTYSFMDTVDSWIERCRDGSYEREGRWLPFRARREVVARKRKPPVERTFYENDHGVLDGDPSGLRLCTRWSCSVSGADSIAALTSMLRARDVASGMALVGRMETAWSWVLADRAGSIGFQMSGLMPRRRAGVSGLVPLPGWDPANDWSGFVAPEELPRCLNPEDGFFVTANHDLNPWGRAKPLNMPMGPWRAGRIRELLAAGRGLTVDDMGRMQNDVLSPHAQAFMRVLSPLLPDTPQARALREWDFRYDADSRGAFLFECVYAAIRRGVFGRAGQFLQSETGVFADFYHNFDRVLLSERSAWFDGPRDEIYRRAAAEALAVAPRAWGESQRVTLTHILFGGRLPRFLGFDRGPIALKGGRATIHQGQVYRSGGRVTSFAPGYRFVTDFGEEGAHTILCGGPSDRRFSGRYCSELDDWVAGRTKRLRMHPPGAGD